MAARAQQAATCSVAVYDEERRTGGEKRERASEPARGREDEGEDEG